jgi:hypothetical protein
MNDYVLGYFRPIFQIGKEWVEGVQVATGKAMPSFGVVAEQNATIVRIDLQSSPQLQFYTSGAADLGGHTITEFLTAKNTPLSTVLAINGALAAPCGPANVLFGAAISQGKVVCDPTQPVCKQSVPDVRDSADAGTVALTITIEGCANGPKAEFKLINKETGLPPDWKSIHTAIAGSPNIAPGQLPPARFNTGLLLPGKAKVLDGGWNFGIPFRPENLNSNDDAVWLAGRTAIGLSKDGRYLFLLTIDGVEDQSMRYGATFYDVGQWLLIAGAYDGITVDGGGSTAMAMMARQGDGSFVPVLMNVPHGTEGPPYLMRSNAQFFGVVVPGVISDPAATSRAR